MREPPAASEFDKEKISVKNRERREIIGYSWPEGAKQKELPPALCVEGPPRYPTADGDVAAVPKIFKLNTLRAL